MASLAMVGAVAGGETGRPAARYLLDFAAWARGLLRSKPGGSGHWPRALSLRLSKPGGSRLSTGGGAGGGGGGPLHTAGETSTPQPWRKPVSPRLWSRTRRVHVPCCWSPSRVPRSPSGRNVPVNGAVPPTTDWEAD